MAPPSQRRERVSKNHDSWDWKILEKPKPEAPAMKPPKFYPADDVKIPRHNRNEPKPTKLWDSITPRTVLILLAGRFKGKRVVLKNNKSLDAGAEKEIRDSIPFSFFLQK
ncbi:hypothetical protein RIF29_25558 [Crotalaria pallida]|uniref:60S ribosomal protein L6 n=1 Tax=Crotalaria pallida TaxID=3830 RepID=A0AAN9EMD5_CROPI